MKNKVTVGLFGKLHGVQRKLERDLPSFGYVPFEIDPGDLAHPPGTVAVICANLEKQFDNNHASSKGLNSLRLLIESLKDDQTQLIFVSISESNQS